MTTDLETLLEETRALDLARIDDRFRLGELAEAMRRRRAIRRRAGGDGRVDEL